MYIQYFGFARLLLKPIYHFTQVTVRDSKGSKTEDEPPPVWFRSYMDKVRIYYNICPWVFVVMMIMIRKIKKEK